MSQQTALRTTPLTQWHHDNGGQMVPFAGWDMPVQYQTKIVAEHLATRKAAGLFDVSHMGRFIFEGKDKISFLQHALTNNCLALEPWQAQYTIIADQQGGAVDDAFLYRMGEDRYLLVVNASNAEKDMEAFQGLLRGQGGAAFDGVTISDVTESLSLLAVQGPASKQLLAGLLTGGTLPEPKRGYLSQAALGGIELTISRTGYTGEPNSFELFVDANQALQLWQMLIEQGAPLGVLPVGLGARDTLRLEAGMPLYGHELGLDPDGQPIPIFAIQLAPIAVSFSPLKGAFVGREALRLQYQEFLLQRKGIFEDSKILQRVIRPLALQERGVARQGARVFQGDKEVGVVTSGTAVPYWGFKGEGTDLKITDKHTLRSLAQAYLDADITPDAEVQVQVRKRRLRGMVVESHGRSDAAPYFHPLPVGWHRPQLPQAEAEGAKGIEILLERALDNHRLRQEQCINLIPSEQSISPLVRMLSVSDPVGRYAEHRSLRAAFDREAYFYQGTEFITWVEEMLAVQMGEYLECSEVELRPTSGQMANMTLFSAMVAWKNLGAPKSELSRIGLVLNHHLGKGGHLSAQPMGGLRDYVAKDPNSERFAVINFPVRTDDPFQVDLEETAALLDQYDPELIIFGRSMTLNKEPVAEVARMVAGKQRRPILMYDMAHTLGLLGPHFQNPLHEGADLITASTHKTFFGTQRGVIGCRFSEEDGPYWELWQTIHNRAFPGMTSNHHLGSLLGLYAAALEMNAFKDQYQPRVVGNAKAFAKALADQGLKVCGDPSLDYTQTHQVVIEVGYSQGIEAAERLEENNIIVNYQALPADEGFTASSGLRMGVQEMTRFAMQEKDFAELAGLVAEVILHGRTVKQEVAKLRGRFTQLNYCFDNQAIADLEEKLLATF